MARIEFVQAPDGQSLQLFREELHDMAVALNVRRQSTPALPVRGQREVKPLSTVTVGEVHKDPLRQGVEIFYAFFADHDRVARKMFVRAARSQQEKTLHTQARIAKQRRKQARRPSADDLRDAYQCQLVSP
jgi:hypothetical protein